MSFPIQPQAIDALKRLQQESIGYVQLVITLSLSLSLLSHTHTHTHTLLFTVCCCYSQEVDVKKELIELDRTEVDVSADLLPQLVPEESPRYHFYRFKHTHEGDYQEVIGELALS